MFFKLPLIVNELLSPTLQIGHIPYINIESKHNIIELTIPHFLKNTPSNPHIDKMTTNENLKNYIFIKIYPKQIWKNKPPKNRSEAHLNYLANQDAWIGTDVKKCMGKSFETNLTSFFRDESNFPRFPEPQQSCAENTNCISDFPAVFFSIDVPVEYQCETLLVTGDSSVSTFTTPRNNELPLTVWTHEEPVSNLHWAGEFISQNGKEYIFIASPVNPELSLISTQRINVAQTIINTINAKGN